MKNRFFRITPLALMVCTALPADTMWYMGAGAGSAKAVDYKNKSYFSGSVDESSTSKELLLGYRFHTYGAIEATYSDLGEVKFNGLWDEGGGPVADSGSLKTTGTKVAVIGMLPFGNPWRIFGKIGLMKWSVKEDELYGGTPLSTSWSGTSKIYGLGMQFDIHEYADLRLEWERNDNIEMTYAEGHVDNYSAKLIWKFGKLLKRR
jgi:hypothetical protein